MTLYEKRQHTPLDNTVRLMWHVNSSLLLASIFVFPCCQFKVYQQLGRIFHADHPFDTRPIVPCFHRYYKRRITNGGLANRSSYFAHQTEIYKKKSCARRRQRRLCSNSSVASVDFVFEEANASNKYAFKQWPRFDYSR